jgi:hypothetical protein
LKASLSKGARAGIDIKRSNCSNYPSEMENPQSGEGPKKYFLENEEKLERADSNNWLNDSRVQE